MTAVKCDTSRYPGSSGPSQSSVSGTTSTIFTPAGDDRVAELIDAYLAVGGNCIDTAHIYGFGESEKALGR